uniref:Protein TsetseEP domain-containing protein n=1 Tax=Musca domestica TaxID=7370 RepID=T1PKK6_MUSDO
MQRNPARTISCSDYFLPAIECITHQFEESNKLCAETAAAARAAAEAETLEVQKELALQADDSCGAIVECKNVDGAQSKLKCYVDNGSEGSKGLRTLSNNANLKSSKFSEQLRRIDSQESVCITNGRLKYESDSAEAYDEFTSCIYGQTTVPSEPSHWCPESEEESGV